MAKYFSLKLLRAQQNCHPDRSVPGFPATRHSPASTCAAFSKESRMKFANATNLDRKSGVAQWRDLLFLFQFSHRLGRAGNQSSRDESAVGAALHPDRLAPLSLGRDAA